MKATVFALYMYGGPMANDNKPNVNKDIAMYFLSFPTELEKT